MDKHGVSDTELLVEFSQRPAKRRKTFDNLISGLEVLEKLQGIVGPDLMEMMWNYGRLMFDPDNPSSDESDESDDPTLHALP